MQCFKPCFLDETYISTQTTIQRCLRLNDLDEVGDGTHFLDFEMIGLFSFRQWNLKQTIDFFIEFLNRLDIKPDYITLHPDKFEEWKEMYKNYPEIEIRIDQECIWSDGNIGGYCTEFYKDGIEIGNIVNPLGTCIDVGFGLERLLMVKNKKLENNRLEIIERCCDIIIDSGVKLGHHQQSSILKKLIITSILEGSQKNHCYFEEIRKNLKRNYQLYLKDKDKKHLKDKPDSYFKSSYGIDPKLIDVYDRVLR